VLLSIRQKVLPGCRAGASNGDTLGCCIPRWSRHCGASRLPLEALRVKTQFLCHVSLGGFILEVSEHVQVVGGLTCFFYCTRFSENQRDRSVGAVSTRLVVSSLVSSRGRVTHLTKFFLSCGLVSLYFTFFLMKYMLKHVLKK
jgi:hypothetical protein